MFSVCSSCKSPPSVRLEEGLLPAGLCKFLKIKNYIISYHSSVSVTVFVSFIVNVQFMTHYSYALGLGHTAL